MNQNLHAQAAAASLTPTERARWIAYVQMKRAKGEVPLSAHEAAAQVRQARPEGGAR